VRATADCIAGCRLEDLFADSKFLRAEVLNPNPIIGLVQTMFQQSCASRVQSMRRSAARPTAGRLHGAAARAAQRRLVCAAAGLLCTPATRRALQRTSEAVRTRRCGRAQALLELVRAAMYAPGPLGRIAATGEGSDTAEARARAWALAPHAGLRQWGVFIRTPA
jgi:hypothetical protein